MFSFSKKKDSKKRGRPDRSSEENEFGIKIDKGQDDKQLEAELRALAGVDSLPEEEINLNEGEDDVELELLRLVGGGKSKKPPPRKAPGTDPPLGEIMADIGDGVDPGEEDDDAEVDENDPDLLSELLELTEPDAVGADVEEEEEDDDEQESTPSAGESNVMGVLKERLKMYKTAEAKAKEGNESSRARRFARGIKTLEDLIKKAKAGKAVSPNDIPPVIALNLKPAPPIQPAGEGEENGTENEMSGEPAESEDLSNQMNSKVNIESPQADEGSGDIMETLTERLKMYKMAEAKAKETGETTRARRFNRGIKTLEGLIRQANAGKPVAPADIPPAVALNLKPAPPVPPPSEEGEDEAEVNEEAEENETNNVDLGETSSNETRVSQEPERNIMDVLSERLQMYKTAEAKAKESGETTRARRFGRGIKTLQDLIKQATAGKPIPQEDIPPPIALNLKPAPLVTRQEEDEPRDPAIERDDLVRSSNPTPSMPPLKFSAVDDVDLDEELLEEELEVPATVLEGLEQRLRMYRKLQERAQEEGNESLADENKKFVRIYLNAIATFKNGGYVDVLGLPAPKGAPPIPIPFYMPEN